MPSGSSASRRRKPTAAAEAAPETSVLPPCKCPAVLGGSEATMGNTEHSATQGGTRYHHTSRSGGSQDLRERKDEGWESRQGGPQHHDEGSHSDGRQPKPDRGGKLGGTNTQGRL